MLVPSVGQNKHNHHHRGRDLRVSGGSCGCLEQLAAGVFMRRLLALQPARPGAQTRDTCQRAVCSSWCPELEVWTTTHLSPVARCLPTAIRSALPSAAARGPAAQRSKHCDSPRARSRPAARASSRRCRRSSVGSVDLQAVQKGRGKVIMACSKAEREREREEFIRESQCPTRPRSTIIALSTKQPTPPAV